MIVYVLHSHTTQCFFVVFAIQDTIQDTVIELSFCKKNLMISYYTQEGDASQMICELEILMLGIRPTRDAKESYLLFLFSS